MSVHISLNSDLEDHVKALGVGSVAAYKLWCYRQGISTALDKTPDQLQDEIDLTVSDFC